MTIYFDFETKSSVDLKKHGLHRYMNDPDADIVCLGIQVDNAKPFLWYPGMPEKHTYIDKIINKIQPNHSYVAFNAYFDWHIWNKLGVKYGFAKLPIYKVIDLKALCARYGYPQSLDKAAKVLGLTEQKDARGKALMKKISMPPFEYTPEELQEYYAYCIQDAHMLYELHKALPADNLSMFEQNIWEMTVQINDTGIPVDVDLAKQILKVTKVYQEERSQILPELTDQAVTKVTQVQRIKEWCRGQGYTIENMQAPTLEAALKDTDMPANVREVLVMRQDLGKSSLAKFEKVIDLQYKGKMYDNLIYHGTLTGRFSGRGFQIHSLPRNSLNDEQIADTIDKFYNLEILFDNPIVSARELIRPIIQVKWPNTIMAADYTAIENRLLSWYADDYRSLKLFRDGLDQYIDMAVTLSHKDYDNVTKEERRKGKIIILGCGYGMGPGGFKITAESMDWKMSNNEAINVVSAYRYKYQKIVQLWYALNRAAISAIQSPGTACAGNTKCSFICKTDRAGVKWLTISLPTGHNLYYNSPTLEKGKYGPIIKFMGIHPKTHKWISLSLISNKIINNIVQATARDVLVSAKLALAYNGFNIIASLHDEIIINHPSDSKADFADMINIMVAPVKGLAGLPLAAEGYIGKYYRKF